MLHARGENHDEQFLNNVAPVVDEAASVAKANEIVEAVIKSGIEAIDEDADDTGKDSGNESAETDSDTEDKKESFKAISNALVGMNVSKHF